MISELGWTSSLNLQKDHSGLGRWDYEARCMILRSQASVFSRFLFLIKLKILVLNSGSGNLVLFFFSLQRKFHSVHSCYSAWKACIRLRPIITSIFFLNIIGTFLAFFKATGIIALLHFSIHNIFFSTQF